MASGLESTDGSSGDGWIEYQSCPHCGGTLGGRRQYTSAPHLTVEFCGGSLPVKAVAVFVQCQTCGLILQSPRMSDERLELYYSSGNYRNTLGSTIDEMLADENKRAKETAEWLHYYPESHLDIGCSSGAFLNAVGANRRFGYDEFTGYAGGITLVGRNTIEKHELVSALHVLEHTPDPWKELAWYKSLSCKYVLVEVPAVTAPLRLPHLWYFPPKVLSDMFVGMRIERMECGAVTRILAEI